MLFKLLFFTCVFTFSIDATDLFVKGIYINYQTSASKTRLNTLLTKAKKYGVNTLVFDAQPKIISKSRLQVIKNLDFRIIARMVVFPRGLARKQPSKKKIKSLKKIIYKVCESRFDEIQLDYIRYSDTQHINLTYKQKYDRIGNVIQTVKDFITQTCPNMEISADIFGRVVFNRNDPIGQKVENFAEKLTILYPMLYPSHFFESKYRQRKPYLTIYQGIKAIQKRVPSETKIIPYIQGFDMLIKLSGLDLKNYILRQMQACVKSGSQGFIVWNIHNQYKETFWALGQLQQKK